MNVCTKCLNKKCDIRGKGIESCSEYGFDGDFPMKNDYTKIKQENIIIREKSKIEVIQERIKSIKQERENLISRIKEGIIERIGVRTYKSEYNTWKYKYNKDFLDFLGKELPISIGSNKKLKKQYNKRFKKLTIYKFKDFFYRKEFPNIKWKQLEFHIRRILRYQDEFIAQKERKELERLTKCLTKLDGSNPCKTICEECGYENEVEANFCSQCGEIIK